MLYEHGAELVMGGNDHNYERFAPQTPDGFADPLEGIRQFVVGTGGRFLRPVSSTPEPNSEALDNTTFGILRLELHVVGLQLGVRPRTPAAASPTRAPPPATDRGTSPNRSARLGLSRAASPPARMEATPATQSAALTERQITVSGLRTRLLEAGPAGAREAIVFVHGNPGSADDWKDLAGRTGAFARSVAFDMPGFGHADKPRDFEYSVPGETRFLDAALSELGIDRVHFVLHDLGGPWGMEWAARQSGPGRERRADEHRRVRRLQVAHPRADLADAVAR